MKYSPIDKHYLYICSGFKSCFEKTIDGFNKNLQLNARIDNRFVRCLRPNIMYQ